MSFVNMYQRENVECVFMDNTNKHCGVYEKMKTLGPEVPLLNPPERVAILSNKWSPGDTKIETFVIEKGQESNKLCIALHNVLSKEECQHLISLAEQRGFSPENVAFAEDNTQACGINNNNNKESCINYDASLMDQVWRRVVQAIEEKDKFVYNHVMNIPWMNGRAHLRNNANSFHAVGLNERVRFYRYGVGCSEAVHTDCSHVRSTEAGIARYGEQSFVSFQLSLNENFKGGDIRFQPSIVHTNSSGYRNHSPVQEHMVRAYTGTVLLFQHDCCHEMTTVQKGSKYSMCSEVMFSTQGKGASYSSQPIIARQFDDLY